MTSFTKAFSIVCLALLATCSAQFLADDNVKAPSFNSSLYISGPGGYQQVLYEDAMTGEHQAAYMDGSVFSNLHWNLARNHPDRAREIYFGGPVYTRRFTTALPFRLY